MLHRDLDASNRRSRARVSLDGQCKPSGPASSAAVARGPIPPRWARTTFARGLLSFVRSRGPFPRNPAPLAGRMCAEAPTRVPGGRVAAPFARFRDAFADASASEQCARDAVLRTPRSEAKKVESERRDPTPLVHERVPEAREAAPCARFHDAFASTLATERCTHDSFLRSPGSEAKDLESERRDPTPLVHERVPEAREAAPCARFRDAFASTLATERCTHDSFLRSPGSEAKDLESERRDPTPLAHERVSGAREAAPFARSRDSFLPSLESDAKDHESETQDQGSLVPDPGSFARERAHVERESTPLARSPSISGRSCERDSRERAPSENRLLGVRWPHASVRAERNFGHCG